MSDTPQYSSREQVYQLIEEATKEGKLEQLLQVLLTQDEQDALISRVNIIRELLIGDMSQRQISQMLGVGVATITRGSNELKRHPQEINDWLLDLIDK